YNVIRWLTESNSGGFAEAQIVYDPRTGQEFHTGIVIDSDLAFFGNLEYPFEVQPEISHQPAFLGDDAEYAQGMRMQAGFGIEALRMLGYMSGYQIPDKFKYDYLKSIVLHESGHDWGLQHNFIAPQAYTAKDEQSKAFNDRMGVGTSVMEYAPINLWPKGYAQGDYWTPTIGPYDYYVIHWGYARIPGAKTPQDEKPVLNQWASAWSNPLYRFASDEDVSYFNAHAIDPRVSHWVLTNDTLGWCDTRMKLANELVASLNQRSPRPGYAFEEETDAFGFALFEYQTCADVFEHFVGGEFLSRAHAGDPGASAPLVAEPRSEEVRAWGLFDKYVLGDSAWQFSPALLNRMTYAEWSPFWEQGTWSYNPPPRHDAPMVEIAEQFQDGELGTIFQPLMLQRIDDLSTKAKPGQTMSLADLFAWTQQSVFGDLHNGSLTTIPIVHRGLQQHYVSMLASLLLSPAPGTPFDAQALAREELVSLQSDLHGALGSSKLDTITRAHLELLQARVSRTLSAQTTVPAGS
ncbi:MAG TPA: zinc-dependent metalloprotease, partial [Candidatus Eremiobacteraceae bacterium]|nr:zinc-dependent metalloprotease [Candidatus Eremiobacteraceae bacterium]